MNKLKKQHKKRIAILGGLIGISVFVRVIEYLLTHYSGNGYGQGIHPLLSTGFEIVYFAVIISTLICSYFFLRDSGKWGQRLRTGIIWCFIALCCFTLLEVLMIVSEPYLFKGFYQYDQELGFKVRPYMNGTNQFGFNDRDYALSKPENIFRILIAGDSFSWAGGKEGNYTALLEKKFEEYYGVHHVDVINAGYPMTHTGEQLALLKKYALQYHPDMVILGFFAGNDFIDAVPYRKIIVVNDTYFFIDERYEKTFMGYPIVGKSRLWYFIKQKLRVLRGMSDVHASESNEQTLPSNQNENCTFSEEAFLKIEKPRLEFCNKESYQKGRYQPNIDLIFTSIAEMQNLLSRQNIQLIVGIYPDEFQVDQQLFSQIIERFNMEKDDYEIELMQRILKQYLDSRKIAHIDFLDTFRSKSQEGPLYLCRNTHWNEAGNELAASLLFQYLLPTVNSSIQEK
jgi:hypothetical protein